MADKIDSVSFKNIRDDISRFIWESSRPDIWSPQYFQDLTEKIRFSE